MTAIAVQCTVDPEILAGKWYRRVCDQFVVLLENLADRTLGNSLLRQDCDLSWLAAAVEEYRAKGSPGL